MSSASAHDLTTLHVRRAVDGDRESLGWVVGRFTPLLRAQASYRLGPTLARSVDPDDVVAEAWLVALRRLPEFEAGDRRFTPGLLGFLAKIVQHVANNQLRKHLRSSSRGIADGEDAASDPSRLEDPARGVITQAARAEASSEVSVAIGALDDDARTVVILRGIEGFSYQELGPMLGESANTLSRRYRRAIAKLREVLPESIFNEVEDS